ncbi:MAG: sugar phosphate nucleotidyltransferase [Acidobacteriota bacterium]
MTPTQAMILAAGLGTRMRPLTLARAKPLLPVLNRPLIAHILQHLAAHGVERAVINAHHMPDQIEQEMARWGPPEVDIIISRETTIRGTAGGLKKAARHFHDAPIFLVNSDSLTDADLRAAARAHADSGRLATMIVKPHDPAGRYRPVMVADAGSGASPVVGIAGRSWGHGVARTFTGVHVLEAHVLDAIPSKGKSDINADIYPRLIDENRDAVGAWMHEGWWFEAGDPSGYLALNLQMLDRTRRGCVVGPSFFVDEEAGVEHSVLGARVRLERGASIEHSVLWDGVFAHPGVSVSRCVVTDGVQLPAGSAFTSSIIRRAEGGSLTVDPLGEP